ncbi:phosphotransferase [Rothia sp. P7208]|uniref:phosphotransferase n=1 Tax=Rothia sp. P7208 TaxID=3402660 RepID=UPI003AD09879
MTPHHGYLEQAQYLPVVQAVMAQAGLNISQDRWDIRTSGSAHIVINMGGELSVRVAKSDQVARHVARRTEVLRRLPHHFSFEVPRPITRTITRQGFTAVGLRWIKGEPRNPGPAPAKYLAQIVREIHRVDYEGMEPYLDSAHQHWGGEDGLSALEHDVLPRLLKTNRSTAQKIIQQVHDLPEVEPVLIHNDLAGHNILWNGDKLTGVIDWDHATLADPAYDYASLGNWYGWDCLSSFLGEDEIHRAQIISRLVALEAVAYAIHNGKGGGIIRLAVERADHWLQTHRQSLIQQN